MFPEVIIFLLFFVEAPGQLPSLPPPLNPALWNATVSVVILASVLLFAYVNQQINKCIDAQIDT